MNRVTVLFLVLLIGSCITTVNARHQTRTLITEKDAMVNKVATLKETIRRLELTNARFAAKDLSDEEAAAAATNCQAAAAAGAVPANGKPEAATPATGKAVPVDTGPAEDTTGDDDSGEDTVPTAKAPAKAPARPPVASKPAGSAQPVKAAIKVEPEHSTAAKTPEAQRTTPKPAKAHD